MKKTSLLGLLALFIVVLYAEPIEVLFVTGDWEPYVSDKLPGYGPVTEMISAICKEADIIPKYQFYPWPRTERMIEDGDAFAAFPYAFSAERKAKYIVSEPLYSAVNPVVYYTGNAKTKNFNYTGVQDLKNYSVGVQSGSFVEKELSKAGVKYETTTDFENTIMKLKAGRIDFVIDEQLVIYTAIRKLYPNEVDQFKTCAKPFMEKMPNGLIVAKKYPNHDEILKRFNNGLKKIKENGKYDQLIKKYKLAKS